MDNPVLSQWLTQPGGLSTLLSEARQAAGLTGVALANRLDWPQSRVSRIQAGRQVATRSDVAQWAEACDAPGLVDAVEPLLSEASARHLPWRLRLARGHAGAQEGYNVLHRESERVVMVETALIPSPLQTKSYSRAVLSALSNLVPQIVDLDASVSARAARSVTDDAEGPAYEFIVSEAALLGSPASKDVMLEQLEHLRNVITYEGVTFRLLELTPDSPVVPLESFRIYRIEDQNLVLVETFSGETEYSTPERTADYIKALDWLREAAVTGSECRQVINRAIRRHRR